MESLITMQYSLLFINNLISTLLYIRNHCDQGARSEEYIVIPKPQLYNRGIFLAYQASRELETNFLALAMFGILTDFFFLSIQSLSHRNCQGSFSFPNYFSLSVIYSTYTTFCSPSVRTEYFSTFQLFLSVTIPPKDVFIFMFWGG